MYINARLIDNLPMDPIPAEVVEERIVIHFSPSSLLVVTMLSKGWNALASDPRYWIPIANQAHVTYQLDESVKERCIDLCKRGCGLGRILFPELKFKRHILDAHIGYNIAFNDYIKTHKESQLLSDDSLNIVDIENVTLDKWPDESLTGDEKQVMLQIYCIKHCDQLTAARASDEEKADALKLFRAMGLRVSSTFF